MLAQLAGTPSLARASMSFSMGSLMVRSPFSPKSNSARLRFMVDSSPFMRRQKPLFAGGGGEGENVEGVKKAGNISMPSSSVSLKYLKSRLMGSARSNNGGGSADRNNLQAQDPQLKMLFVFYAMSTGTAGPVNGEMDVLEQHPAAVLVGIGEVVHGDGLLTLA
ncbi:MAG: hypothetical protein FRX49_10895 [Trebouxia sp. A1-2]|nr:MAG: hypothetical protein FRX49_10895 [Trebouxia sp. A1-2]